MAAGLTSTERGRAVRNWTTRYDYAWFTHLGVHRLSGTVRYQTATAPRRGRDGHGDPCGRPVFSDLRRNVGLARDQHRQGPSSSVDALPGPCCLTLPQRNQVATYFNGAIIDSELYAGHPNIRTPA